MKEYIRGAGGAVGLPGSAVYESGIFLKKERSPYAQYEVQVD